MDGEFADRAGAHRRGGRDGGPVTQAELATVIQLVRELEPVVVNVGHGRDRGSAAWARAFESAWSDLGGHVGAIVSWPSVAASWLRQATRLAAGADVWVIADEPAGWAGIGPRLADTGRWRADRTVAFAGLADPALPLLAGRRATDGLHVAGSDGGRWRFAAGWLRTGSGPAQAGRR